MRARLTINNYKMLIEKEFTHEEMMEVFEVTFEELINELLLLSLIDKAEAEVIIRKYQVSQNYKKLQTNTTWTDAEIAFVKRCMRTPSEVLAKKINKMPHEVDVLKLTFLTDRERNSCWQKVGK